MRIIFVRHGHPNYQLDCLTPLGQKQAEAVAKRLHEEKIDVVCASTKGRAMETAAYIAEDHGLEVNGFDFMREISWGSVDDESIFENGHPWRTVNDMIAKGKSLLSPNWAQEEFFCRNKVVQYVQDVGDGLDAWLKTFGYEREGEFFRVNTEKNQTVVMASHGGSSSAALSRLFSLPFPYVVHTINPTYTAITIVELSGAAGTLAAPRFELMNDARHIQGIEADLVFEQ
ncbi:MAG: histidine phosphatase family protein [Clostridia bacterium]|nr:histidine phosphatase family protein [Clostridia bacterium]